jgi:hypothetical protein
MPELALPLASDAVFLHVVFLMVGGASSACIDVEAQKKGWILSFKYHKS